MKQWKQPVKLVTATKQITLDGDEGWSPAAASRHFNAYVLRCIQLHAGSVASVPIVRADNRERIDIPQAVIYAADASLLLAGAAYLLPPSRTTPWRVLNPFTVSVQTDPARGITGFVQRVGTLTTTFPTDRLVYVRTWHPHDDLGPGLSAYDAARGAVDTLDSAEAFTRAFFTQGALPPIVVKPSPGSVMNDADVNALTAAFRAVVSGVRNAWRALILRGDITVQALDMPSLANLAMRDVVDVARQRIAVAFGIPQSMLEDAANYATAREHRISFWRETVVPAATIIADALSAQYYRLAHNVDVVVDAGAIEALQQDEATKAAAVVSLFDAGIISRDEARELLNIAPAPSAPVQEEEDATRVLIESRPARKARRDENDQRPDLDEIIAKTERAVMRVFEEWRKRITDAITERASVSDDELAGFKRDFADALRPLLIEAATTGVEAYAAPFNVMDFDLVIDLVDEWLQRYPFVDAVDETTRTRLAAILRQVAAAEIGNEEALAKLSLLFGRARASTIAITEITRAYAESAVITQQMLAASGITTVLRWRTSNDELVCPICGPRNGKKQGDGWTDPPPAHQRCRCWVTLEVQA